MDASYTEVNDAQGDHFSKVGMKGVTVGTDRLDSGEFTDPVPAFLVKHYCEKIVSGELVSCLWKFDLTAQQKTDLIADGYTITDTDVADL